MIRNQQIKLDFICEPFFCKWMGVFQSWLDCFSIGVLTFIQNINFSSSVIFVYCCPFVLIFQCCNLQFHYTFFQKQQTTSDVLNSLQRTLHKCKRLISFEEIIQI